MTTTRTRGNAKLRWAYLVLLGFAVVAAAIMHLLGVASAFEVGLIYGASCVLPALVNQRAGRLASTAG